MSFQEEISKTAWEYVGNGRWIFGVPKRNLSQKDLIKFNIDPSVLKRSGLYRKVHQKQEPKKEIKIRESFPEKGKED